METSINTIAYILIALGLNTLASLGGGFIPSALLHRHMQGILSCASGVLLGATFFDLLPEALELGKKHSLSQPLLLVTALAGFVSFHFVESFLGSHAIGQEGHRHDQTGPLLLAGDALHNLADGAAIASAFIVDESLGWITTFSVIIHELPQEVADYTILIARGWNKHSALMALLIVQTMGFLGAGAALFLSHYTSAVTPILLMVSAGGFLYVAAADLLPSLHNNSQADGTAIRIAKPFWLICGVALMGALAFLRLH